MKKLLTASLLLVSLAALSQDASFGPPILVDDNVDFAFKVASLDVNADGFPDVVAAAYAGEQLTLYLNDGAGNLGPPDVFYLASGGLPNMVTGDVDGDGDQDLVVNEHFNKVLWFENDNSGTFGAPQEVSALGGASGPHGLDVGDMDYDGDLDVLIGNYSGDSSVRWYENNGAGVFTDVHTLVTGVSFLTGVEAADLNGDGAPEVVYGSTTEDAYYWMENNGYGGFTDPILLASGIDYAERTVCEDLDGDGDLDILCSSGTENPAGVHWMRNQGDGNFTPEYITHLPVTGSGIDSRTLCVSDLDLDGDMDLLISSINANGLALEDGATACYWFENLSAGIFDTPVLLPGFPDAFGAAGGIVTADLDGDSDPEVIAAWRANDYVTVHENLLGAGCTDPSACNYDPGSWNEDGSCCYTNCGCTDPASLNYEPGASCDDGSCSYALSGVVFNDINGDGYMGAGDYGLPFQEVTLSPGDITLITNDEGAFFTVVGEGYGAAQVAPNPTFPFVTTDNPQLYDGAENTFLEFGLTDEEPVYDICIDFYPSGNNFLCNDWSNHNICFRNMSNEILSGVVTVEYDLLFQGHQAGTPIDSVNQNAIYMSYAGLLPGEMMFYDVGLLTPTVDHIGEWVHSVASITGFHNGEQVAMGVKHLEMEVTCAYDPNDKQAFPLGYGDDHRLLPGTEQEYLVRFQNTGNAPAQDVVIVDTLDVNFDLETFEIVANSHSMSAVINEVTREIRFQFFDIQLPDSTCCEEDSHGLVSYKVRSLPGLEPETRLENTAYIFFDNNEPIITNTTWTTIHACQEEVLLTAAPLPGCPVQLTEVSSDYITYPGLDNDFYWTSDAGYLGGDDTQQLPGLYSGGVQLTVDNPLCTNTASLDWTNPDPGFVWLTCPGDLNCDGLINATDVVGLLGQYGCDTLCLFEVTGDGKVDSEDMLAVLGAFGTGCE